MEDGINYVPVLRMNSVSFCSVTSTMYITLHRVRGEVENQAFLDMFLNILNHIKTMSKLQGTF